MRRSLFQSLRGCCSWLMLTLLLLGACCTTHSCSSSSTRTWCITTADPFGVVESSRWRTRRRRRYSLNDVWRSDVVLGRLRGGSTSSSSKEHEQTEYYTTVGVLSLLEDEEEASLPPTTNMVQRLLHEARQGHHACIWAIPSTTRETLLLGRFSNKDVVTAAETIGTMCPILIVVGIKGAEAIPEDLLLRLMQGVERRKAPGQKSSLILLLTQNENDDDLNLRIEQVARNKLLSTELLDSLEVVPWDQWQRVVQEVLEEEHQLPQPVPLEAFPLLVGQVHQSLRGDPKDVWFEKVSLENVVGMDDASSSVDNTTTIVDHSNKTAVELNNTESIDRKETLTQLAQNVWQQAETQMAALEAKQDEVMLHATTKIPILEFGADANTILKGASEAFDTLREFAVDEDERQRIQEARSETLNKIAGDGGLRRLFHEQLQSLREHYGRRYESVLDEFQDRDDTEKGSDEKRNQSLTEAAKRATEGFRAAAQNAVPAMCHAGQELRDVDGGYDYVSTLSGLLTDMMEATAMREEMDEQWNAATSWDDGPGDGDDTAAPGKKRRKGPAKWYKKLAARALVLGVNYLQGWLAWQGIRKAAADRDRDMPKFPLF